MWSFEKLHRSMAHLFLGQLVATFDEEFRILFAHSQPLTMEDMSAPGDDFSLLQQRNNIKETPLMYRDPRQFQSLDICLPGNRRHFYDEPMDVDWRLMPLKRQASLHAPSDTYNRFSSQQPYDQNHSRIAMLENPAFKRHSYAEGGRFSYPFLQQQGIPVPEKQGRHDKFQSQDLHSGGQYSEPCLPQTPDNFDPVLNYLSSARNVEFDQGSEKPPPAANLPFSSTQPRRLSLDQTYACQTSPNQTDQNQFFQEPNTDRKDPTVKRGLRNWRITSYLSAHDNPEDDDQAPPQPTERSKDPLNPAKQTAPGMDVSLPKIPNIREFKVPAIPRASQLPNYKKNTAQEEPKTLPDAPTAVAAETASTPSESSSTAEVEKAEEADQKLQKTTALGRDGSFRRNYNAAVPRSSRLRSSLIFSSLDQETSQDTQTAPGQQDEESDTNEAEQNKKPFLSQVLGQRRSARKPLGWSHYLKSSTIDSSGAEVSKSGDGTSKEDEKDTSKKEKSKEEEQESLKPTDTEKVPQPMPSESKTGKPVQRSKSFLTLPFSVDMNDPDKRFTFFKELAAKRKAAKEAEAEKSKDNAPMKPPTDLNTSTTGKKEQNKPEEDSGKMADASSSEDLSPKNTTADDANKTASTVCESVTPSSNAADKTKKQSSHDEKNDSSLSQNCKEEETSISTNTGKTKTKHKQTATSLPVSTETESPSSKPAEDTVLSKAPVKEISESKSDPPTPTKAVSATVPSLQQATDETKSLSLESTLKASGSLSPSSAEVAPPSASAALNPDTENPQSVQLETSVSSPELPPEQQTGSELTHSSPAVENCVSGRALSDSDSQMSQGPPTSNPAPLPSSQETLSPNVAPKDSSLTSSNTLSTESDKIIANKSVSSSLSESSQAKDETSAAFTESSLQSTTKTNSEESPPPSDTSAPEAEDSDADLKVTAEESEAKSSKENTGDRRDPSSSPPSLKSGLPDTSDVDSSTSTPDQIETITLPPECDSSKVCSPVNQDTSPNTSESTTDAQQDALTQEAPPSERSSPLTDSSGPVLYPEAEKTETSSPLVTPSLPSHITSESDKISPPTEPTSKTPTELEPKPASVISESQPSGAPVPAENSAEVHQSEEPELLISGEQKPENTEDTTEVKKIATEGCAKSEKNNKPSNQKNCSEPAENTSQEAAPLSPMSKQPKSSQSRYHSSTANVLSSSNLRDDTKLLLEQISANSQSRNEATKESPVTDEEKEDEASKKAKREKERRLKTLSRGPKSQQEREKLLERIQSMRKERKVYSRFEVRIHDTIVTITHHLCASVCL